MIFNTLITIVGLASCVNLIHETPLYQSLLSRLKLDRKPFNCVMCSTFWVTLGFTVFTHGAQSIFISGIAAITAEIINRQIHKI